MIKETLTARCHECGRDTEWGIAHRFVDWHGVVHCLVCSECGKAVPDFAFKRYQQTGKVVIPV